MHLLEFDAPPIDSSIINKIYLLYIYYYDCYWSVINTRTCILVCFSPYGVRGGGPLNKRELQTLRKAKGAGVSRGLLPGPLLVFSADVPSIYNLDAAVVLSPPSRVRSSQMGSQSQHHLLASH